MAIRQRGLPDQFDRQRQHLWFRRRHTHHQRCFPGQRRRLLGGHHQRRRLGHQHRSLSLHCPLAPGRHRAARQPDDPARLDDHVHRGRRGHPALQLPLAAKRNQFNRWRQHPRLRHQHLDCDQRHDRQRRHLFSRHHQHSWLGRQRRRRAGPGAGYRARRCLGHAVFLRWHQLWLQSVCGFSPDQGWQFLWHRPGGWCHR